MSASRLLVNGASGRMGRALLRLLPEYPQLELVAAIAGADLADDAGTAQVLGRDDLANAPAFDVAIDFSQPQGFEGILGLCRTRGAALVSGTTGLTDRQRIEMQAAAFDISLLWASNFSLGVAVLEDLARRAAGILPGWQVDIVETHHVHKRDAPSGTAITLAEAIVSAGAPVPGVVSRREGEVIGEHTIRFTGLGESVQLSHSAGNRDIFARGALLAAIAIVGRGAGVYRLSDLLFDS